VCDLVVGLVLRATEIEEEAAVGHGTLVAVGDGGALAMAVGAILDSVLVAADGEVRLHVEVGDAVAGTGGEDVVGDGIRGRSADFVTTDLEAGGGGHDGRGEDGREDAGEAHLNDLLLRLGGGVGVVVV
jgi:hypothetical protein